MLTKRKDDYNIFQTYTHTHTYKINSFIILLILTEIVTLEDFKPQLCRETNLGEILHFCIGMKKPV